MTSLIFPDVNVWLAMLLENHVHHATASNWWAHAGDIRAAFTRMTQMGVLRLLTTAAAMDGKPLSMTAAWQAYDSLFADDRVVFHPETVLFEGLFRQLTTSSLASPKRWADSYLIAFARSCQAHVVTFDQALEECGVECLVLK